MPPSNKLTEVKIKNIKPNGKIERFADGEGLYLETSVAGGKFWRMKYRVDGKEKRLSFGEWPAVSLKDARDKRDEAKKQLRGSLDPSTEKKKVSMSLLRMCLPCSARLKSGGHSRRQAAFSAFVRSSSNMR